MFKITQLISQLFKRLTMNSEKKVVDLRERDK